MTGRKFLPAEFDNRPYIWLSVVLLSILVAEIPIFVVCVIVILPKSALSRVQPRLLRFEANYLRCRDIP